MVRPWVYKYHNHVNAILKSNKSQCYPYTMHSSKLRESQTKLKRDEIHELV